MKRIILAFLLVYAGLVNAQHLESKKDPDFKLQQAILNYETGDYAVAKHLLDEYLTEKQTPEALYYRAMSVLKGQFKAGPYYIKDFVGKYPGHPLASKASNELAHYYFGKGEYTEALDAFGKMDFQDLDPVEREQSWYEKGFAELSLKQEAEAQKSFEEALKLKGRNESATSFYLGALIWEEDPVRAFDLLSKAATQDPKWKRPTAVYFSRIFLKKQQYDTLIARNLPLLNTDTTKENYDLHLFTGQAYYSKKQYRSAKRYLGDAFALGSRIPSAEALFMMGHASYELGEKDEAIDYLKKAGLDNNSVGQSSAFQLGKIYVESGNFEYAINAFEIAASSPIDPEVQEEALFLLAKSKLRLARFDEAIVDLETFESRFPQSDRIGEVQELLSIAFLNTSNYDKVIEHFERSESSNPVVRSNYQKVTLLRAKQTFSDGQVDLAVSYLNKSLKYPVNSSDETEAWYWLGESYSVLENYPEAENAYQQGAGLDPTDPVFDYGLGYLDYNTNAYADALGHFSSFLRKAPGNHPFYQDARLRIADCQYALKQYSSAISTYEELRRSSSNPDYIDFQTGIVYQLNGETAKAIRAFDKVIANVSSTYRDNAIFQSGQTYYEAGQLPEGIARFSDYLTQYPNGELVPWARVKRGQGYFNRNEDQSAARDYRFVLDNHMSSKASKDALLGLQELDKRGVEVDFDRYFAKYGSAHPEDGSLQAIEFDQAKNFYYSGEYQTAIRRLKVILDKNPSSAYKEEILYLLGDSHQKLGNLRDANGYYEQVIALGSSTYLTRVLDKRGKVLIAMDETAKAISNYHLLRKSSRNRKEDYQAMEGLLQTHYHRMAWDSVIYYAERISKLEWKPSNGQADADLLKGRAYLAQNRIIEAKTLFDQLSALDDVIGAEAKYNVAKIEFDQGLHEESLETLFDLNKRFGSYEIWIGRSFLLIADNYIALEELLQAKATLTSLVQHFEDEEIKQQAREKLEQVEQLQAEVINDTDQ